MKIERDYDLTELHTFGVPARAKFFTEIDSEAGLTELFSLPEFKENKKMFLGGGSNILFTQDFDGIVVLNKIKGIEILSETEEAVLIRSMSGVIWHDLVLFAADRGWWGIENLSFIPGTVGGALVENLGAYGAELSEVLVAVEAYDISGGTKKIFQNEECKFSYHNSIFKHELSGKYFISAITIGLSKLERKNTKYRAFAEYSLDKKIELKTSKDISDAVVYIRQTKLPDPRVIGNAGSFFRNVFLSPKKMKELLVLYPDMPHYEEGGVMKVPAGWLVEQAGWKGKKVGSVGVHDKHALILVNLGGATGVKVKSMAFQIKESVSQKFGLNLEWEVNLI